MNSHIMDSPSDFPAKNSVAVHNKILDIRFSVKGVAKLLDNPVFCGMVCNIEMENQSSAMPDDKVDIQGLEKEGAAEDKISGGNETFFLREKFTPEPAPFS